MKKLKLLILFSFISIFMVSAQNKKFGKQFLMGAELGFTGSIARSSIYNQNMRKDPNITSNHLLTDKRYGFRASLSRIAKKPFSSLVSIYGEYIYNNYQVEYSSTINIDKIGTYNKQINFNTLDYIFAVRYVYFFQNRKGYYANPIYFDLGLGISNIQSLSETNSGHITGYSRQAEDYSFLTDFAPNTKSIIIGAGMYRKLVNIGFRLYYGIDNLMNEGYFLVNDGIYDDISMNDEFQNYYQEFSPTKKIAVELKIEINLSILSYGRCDMSKVGWSPFKFLIQPANFWKNKM